MIDVDAVTAIRVHPAIAPALAGILACVTPGCDRPVRVDGDPVVIEESAADAGSDASTRFVDGLAGRWRSHSRILLVASTDRSLLVSETDSVRDELAGWLDRDLRLVLLAPEGGLEVEDFVDGGPVGAAFGASDAAAVARRYDLRMASGISAALVGKDGGVKHRWSREVAPSEVFDLVDAMPMRIREVREMSEDAS